MSAPYEMESYTAICTVIGNFYKTLEFPKNTPEEEIVFAFNNSFHNELLPTVDNIIDVIDTEMIYERD